MKSALVALALIGISGAALAQNQTPTSPPTNPPPGTSYSGTSNPYLPPSPSGTAGATALDGPNASAAVAATRAQLESAGFHDVKGITRQPDGVWTARAVKQGVEVAVSIDSGGNIATQ